MSAPHSSSTARPPGPPRVLRALARPWLIGPVLLASSLGAAALVLARPAWLAGAVLALVMGAGFLWLAVSVFWPARADRGCPACGAQALERADPTTTRGVRCRACGHADPHASAWFLAEEEGPLEDVVLAQRRRRR